jgi:hypothetical protein
VISLHQFFLEMPKLTHIHVGPLTDFHETSVLIPFENTLKICDRQAFVNFLYVDYLFSFLVLVINLQFMYAGRTF